MFLLDLRFAVRSLFRRPSFLLIAVVTIALGIGANTVIFSVVNALLLQPLSYRDADRLVRVLASNPEQGVSMAGLAPGDFLDFREHVRGLQGFSAYMLREATLATEDHPEVLRVALVSANLFEVLGASAISGRTFLPQEEEPDQSSVVVLSYDLWQRRFGGQESIAGQQIKLEGQDHSVVGVMPPKFGFPTEETELWAPLVLGVGDPSRRSHYLGAIGRLSSDVSQEQIQEELATVARNLEEAFRDSNEGWGVRVLPLREFIVGRVRGALLAFSGAVGFIFLIACVNIANLLLAHVTSRRGDIALRGALGATKWQVIRLFFTESLILALLGGALGVTLAAWGIRILSTSSGDLLPLAGSIRIDGSVLLYAFGVSLLSSVIFSAAPAIHMSRMDLTSSLRFRSGSFSESINSSRLRSALITLETALALVLLIGAGLMLKAFLRLQRVELGFDSQDALLLQVNMNPSRYQSDEDVVYFLDQVTERLERLPGIRNAAAASSVPLLRFGQNFLPFRIASQAESSRTTGIFVSFSAVTPSYFRAIGVPLLRGRDFDKGDGAAKAPVIIINQTMATRFWRERDPIGDRVLMTVRGSEEVAHEVVGIVGDTRIQDLDVDSEPAVYVPFRQVPHSRVVIALWSDQKDPMALAEPAQQQVLDIDRDQAISSITTFEEIVRKAGSQMRFYTGLLDLFGTLALLLAAVGVYGIVAYDTSQRVREIGIRVAVGADVHSVMAALVNRSLRAIILGVLAGSVMAFFLTGFLSTLIYDVSTRDPVVFVIVPVLLVTVGVVAGVLGCRGALRLDPVTALREG